MIDTLLDITEAVWYCIPIMCEVTGCNRPREYRLPYCKGHNQRIRNNRPLYCDCGSPIPLAKGRRGNLCDECKDSIRCMQDDCSEKAFQKGYCQRHFMSWYRGRLTTPVCKNCGKDTGSQNHIAWYCEDCRKISRNDSARWSNNKRRRQLIGGSRYSRREVYDLDAGTCYLCGELAPWDDFEVEHITSISDGGDDIIENVAVSHLVCNRIKGRKSALDCGEIFINMIIPERWCIRYGSKTKADS